MFFKKTSSVTLIEFCTSIRFLRSTFICLCGISLGTQISVAQEPQVKPTEKAVLADRDSHIDRPSSTDQPSNKDATSTSDTESLDEALDFEVSPHLDNTQTIKIDKSWKRLGQNQIWVNTQAKRVMVRGRICLQAGPLEMFACPGKTKAHESVIATEAKASEIHASLVLLGFDPGKPVQWDPKYTPVEGPSIKILVRWKQGDKTVEVDAKEMVKLAGTDKKLEQDWVFGGSQIYVDNVSGESIYYADAGEMVCLSNFSTAMLDVPMKSSDAAGGLLFEANKDKIPPRNTKVYMVLVPRKTPTDKSLESAPTTPETEKTLGNTVTE